MKTRAVRAYKSTRPRPNNASFDWDTCLKSHSRPNSHLQQQRIYLYIFFLYKNTYYENLLKSLSLNVAFTDIEIILQVNYIWKRTV